MKKADARKCIGLLVCLPGKDKGETLEVARAGTLARELRARGAPADSTVAGIEIGDPSHVRMMFYIRGKDEPRVDFKQLVQ